jgi:hypothetical protein
MKRTTLITIGIALLISLGLAAAFRPRLYPPYDEGKDYVAIANFNYADVSGYYGARVLHPLVVRVVANIARRPVDAQVFRWVSVASLIALFLFLAFYYVAEFSWAPWLFLFLAATATLVDEYRNYYWHDLFYTALCALFFLALRMNRWVSLPILLMLYMTRESTILLVSVLVVVALLRRQWGFALSVLLVGVAGMKATSTLIAHAMPNKHGISMLTLDALKLPFNFAFNICGLEFWTNTNAPTLDAPRWIANLPGWLHLGNIRQVGYSGFQAARPLRLLVLMCSAFGILPALVIRAVTRGGVRLLQIRFDCAIAFAYGALMFVLAPLVGTLPSRYILYSWPIFWIFAVGLLGETATNARRRIEFVLLSLAASWTPALIRLASGAKLVGSGSLSAASSVGLIISLFALIPIYVRAWYLLSPSGGAERLLQSRDCLSGEPRG